MNKIQAILNIKGDFFITLNILKITFHNILYYALFSSCFFIIIAELIDRLEFIVDCIEKFQYNQVVFYIQITI